MRILIAFCLLSIALAKAMAAPAGTMPDLSVLAPAEVGPMQRRLIDAGCYRGAVDGATSRAFQSARRACPPQDPVLTIETGMHVSPINEVATDRDCRIAATASLDKTVRLWSMPDGRLLRTQRLPVGDGPGGQVYAVAISPDGSLIAAGGVDTHHDVNGRFSLYLFDATTGTEIRRFDTVGPIFHVVFSDDGRRLAVAQGYDGIRVIDVATGRNLMSDDAYPIGSSDVAFGPDGTLYTIASDGLLRRYGSGSRRPKIVSLGGKDAAKLAVSPDGQTVAVVQGTSTLVELFESATLKRRGTAGPIPVGQGGFSAVAWSRDGHRLFAAGVYLVPGGNSGLRPMVSFDANGHYLGSTPLSSNTIYGLTHCGDQMLYAGSAPVLGISDGKGHATVLAASHTLDLRAERGEAFTSSPNGAQVRFAADRPARTFLRFDIATGTLIEAPRSLPGYIAADTTSLPITDWAFGNARLNGKLFVDLQENPQPRSDSLAIRPDHEGFVLGLTTFLAAFDKTGKLLWNQPGVGEAWGVNFAQSGKVVVAAYGDGTIRWFRWSDGKALLTLFVEASTRRWVAWTPAGYYMASPGGDDLIGWQVNRGWRQQADFFPASRFRNRFARPDVVQLVLETLDEDIAVAKANEAARRKTDVRPLIDELPPLIRISSPPDGTHVQSEEATISYSLRSPTGNIIDHIDILIDGRPAKQQALPFKSSGQTEIAGTLKVNVTHRESVVGLVAWSGDAASTVANLKLVRDNAPITDPTKGRLFAVVVGVSKYAAADMTLGYAARDAKDFAETLRQQKGQLYGDVQTRLLIDGDATRASIIEGLEWLETAARSPNDVGVLFLAGHGITDAKQMYWFVPFDATPEDFHIKGVSQDEMRRSLQSLSGKVLWFLDTCHAGFAARRPVDASLLVNAVTATESGGIVAFASSSGREVSEERPEWSNGAFTKALIEGFTNGRADMLGEGTLTTSELDAYVAGRVRKLTDDRQHPVMGRPPDVPDFVIARFPAKQRTPNNTGP